MQQSLSSFSNCLADWDADISSLVPRRPENLPRARMLFCVVTTARKQERLPSRKQVLLWSARKQARLPARKHKARCLITTAWQIGMLAIVFAFWDGRLCV
jgi:hypothetical protein